MLNKFQFIVLIALLSCFAISVSAFKAKPASCLPGQSPGGWLGPSCLPCVSGRYCPDGENSYNCPAGYWSPTGSAQCSVCPNSGRPTEDQDACIARDAPQSIQRYYNTMVPLTATPSGFTQFYVGGGDKHMVAGSCDLKLSETIDGPAVPFTVFMSRTSGNPGPNNFEVRSEGVKPAITFTKQDEGYSKLFYFSVKHPRNFYLSISCAY